MVIHRHCLNGRLPFVIEFRWQRLFWLKAGEPDLIFCFRLFPSVYASCSLKSITHFLKHNIWLGIRLPCYRLYFLASVSGMWVNETKLLSMEVMCSVHECCVPLCHLRKRKLQVSHLLFYFHPMDQLNEADGNNALGDWGETKWRWTETWMTTWSRAVPLTRTSHLLLDWHLEEK